jgi:hypothetical protein
MRCSFGGACWGALYETSGRGWSTNARTRMPLGRSSCRPSCCASTTLSIFHVGMKSRAPIQPEAEGTLTFSLWVWGNCMGESGDAFITLITGLAIAAASLFRLA